MNATPKTVVRSDSLMQSTLIAIKDVEKKYKKFLLRISSLEVKESEFLSIIGPSGSGKTTLLKLMGGFVLPDKGKVLVNGLPAHLHAGSRRVIRTVFQDLALFPHLSVYRQLILACSSMPLSKAAKLQKVEQWMERLKLQHRRDHKPPQLSGGEKQRLALGRAMICEPQIVLLDEPMTALDHGLRSDLWQEIDDLASDASAAFVVVTHDPDVALSRSDRIVVVEGGSCVQIGAPAELYRRPANQHVARLLGSANVVDWQGRKLVIRPEQITIGSLPIPGKDFTGQAMLLHRAFLGSAVEYTLSWNKERLLVRGSADEEDVFPPAEKVYFGWDNDDVTFLN